MKTHVAPANENITVAAEYLYDHRRISGETRLATFPLMAARTRLATSRLMVARTRLVTSRLMDAIGHQYRAGKLHTAHYQTIAHALSDHTACTIRL